MSGANVAASHSGTANRTLSVAATDSSGSGEERKFKDDRSQRVCETVAYVLFWKTSWAY